MKGVGRRSRFGRPALGVPAAATVAAAAMGVQAWYAGHRQLPTFGDLDPSGVVGRPGLPEIRLALVGDSTLTGPGLEHVDDLWIRQVARRLGDGYRLRIRSEAVGGARARDALMYQVRAAVAWRPDIAVVSVGANDALRRVRIGRFAAELTAIVTALIHSDAAVVLAGVGDVGTAPRVPFPLKMVVSERSRAADRIHARVAQQHGAAKVRVGELTTTSSGRAPSFSAPTCSIRTATATRCGPMRPTRYWSTCWRAWSLAASPASSPSRAPSARSVAAAVTAERAGGRGREHQGDRDSQGCARAPMLRSSHSKWPSASRAVPVRTRIP